MKPDTQYQPLLSDAPSDDLIARDNDSYGEHTVGSPPQRRPILLWAALVLQTLFIILVSGFALACSKSSCPINPVFAQVLYCMFFLYSSLWSFLC